MGLSGEVSRLCLQLSQHCQRLRRLSLSVAWWCEISNLGTTIFRALKDFISLRYCGRKRRMFWLAGTLTLELLWEAWSRSWRCRAWTSKAWWKFGWSCSFKTSLVRSASMLFMDQVPSNFSRAYQAPGALTAQNQNKLHRNKLMRCFRTKCYDVFRDDAWAVWNLEVVWQFGRIWWSTGWVAWTWAGIAWARLGPCDCLFHLSNQQCRRVGKVKWWLKRCRRRTNIWKKMIFLCTQNPKNGMIQENI